MTETLQSPAFASVDQLSPSVENFDAIQPNRTPGFLGRFRTSRLGQLATIVAATVSVAAGNLFAESSPAHADSSHVYTVVGTDGDGVWLHGDPGLGDKGDLVTVIPEGANIEADCYVNDTPIGERSNPAWLSITYKGEKGFVADYFTDSEWDRNNTLHDQGLPFCGESASNSAKSTKPEDLQPAEAIPIFADYDRSRAASWALEHAKDTPPNAGSCTWFVSNALWKGGIQETNEWNNDPQGVKRDGVRYGTDYAWRTGDFLAYMGTLPYVDIDRLGYLKHGGYNVPKARKGDIIIYDWDGGGTPDHAAVVTGAAGRNPEYPLVSGWSEDGSRPNKYSQRGWTWSEKSDQWITSVDGSENAQAWLIHIRSEDEININ